MANNESVGLLLLLEPGNPAEATVDIVFVHGLGGDRERTWTYTSDRRPSILWPKELLPEKCPKARILTFGYNAQFVHFYFSKKRVPVGTKVDDHSSALLQSLANLRSDTQTTERPIIFVAHSLGGLVCANALSRPDQMDAATKSIVDHTYGTIFLGTPFEGSTKANPGETVLRTLKWLNISTNTDDVKELKKQSERIAEIREEFLTVVRSRDQAGKQIHIACFFETEPTHILKDKKWVSVGVIVEKESATLPTIKPVGIHGDHEEICKFRGNENSGYQAISGLLARWIEDMANPNQPKKESPGISITGDVVYRDNNNYGGTLTGHIAGTHERAVEVTGGKENIYCFDGTRPPKDKLDGGKRH